MRRACTAAIFSCIVNRNPPYYPEIARGNGAARLAASSKRSLNEPGLVKELAERLKEHGLQETETSITGKLARGTFAARFFLFLFSCSGPGGGATRGYDIT